LLGRLLPLSLILKHALKCLKTLSRFSYYLFNNIALMNNVTSKTLRHLVVYQLESNASDRYKTYMVDIKDYEFLRKVRE